MKKFNKVMLIMAGAFASIGCILAIIAICMGLSFKNVATSLIDSIATNGHWGIQINTSGIKFSGISINDSLTEPYQLAPNMSLKISAGGAKVVVEESDNDRFYVNSNDSSLCAWNVDGDTMKVEVVSKIAFVSFGEITVYVPKGYEFKNVKIEVGAGEMIINNINCENLDIEAAAGDINLKNAYTKGVKTEVGAGNVEYQGSVNGNINIEVGAGNVEFYLENSEKDYNYNIECALGNVDFNNYSYAGLATDKKIDNNAIYTVKIECAMGNVTFKTN